MEAPRHGRAQASSTSTPNPADCTPDYTPAGCYSTDCRSAPHRLLPRSVAASVHSSPAAPPGDRLPGLAGWSHMLSPSSSLPSSSLPSSSSSSPYLSAWPLPPASAPATTPVPPSLGLYPAANTPLYSTTTTTLNGRWPSPTTLDQSILATAPKARQMSIQSLLESDASDPSALLSTPPPLPGPAPPLPPSLPPAPGYRLWVRQQPLAARACGFGERDRRVIDPPPIVQLALDDGSPLSVPTSPPRCPFTVLHCSVWNAAGSQDCSAMPEEYRQQRRLTGTLVSSSFVGLDEHGHEGCFFCFPDLSCRTPGTYRLRFALVVLDPAAMRAGGRSPVCATTMTDVFTVYNAKDFPGMQASTPLIRRLRAQGCLVSIKKGNDKTGSVHALEEDNDSANEADGGDGDGDNNDMAAPPRRRHKRRKRKQQQEG